MGFAQLGIYETRVTDGPFDAQIGKIARAWNSIHYVTFAFFVCLTGLDRKSAAAAFYSLKADSAQRQMTMALAERKFALFEQGSPGSEEASEFKRIYKKINHFAGMRNGVVHAVIAVGEKYYVINPDHPPKRDKRDPFDRLDQVNKDLVALLSEQLHCLYRMAQHMEWPEELLEGFATVELPT